MKIGFLAWYSPETLEFAARAGFGALDLGSNVGTLLDAHAKDNKGWKQVQEEMAQAGLELSSLNYFCNHLDAEKGKEHQDYFLALIDLAAKMGVKAVCTFAGAVPGKSIPDNIPEWKKVWKKYAKRAEDKGIKIAIENCPMFCGWPYYSSYNIAYCPAAWDLMFDAVDSPAVGLQYDPSHLYWLHIDHIQVIRDYASRIYRVHAKDTEIFYDRFGREGIYGDKWWRYRMPGWGEMDWQEIINALLEVGYNDVLAIEHEDPIFRGERHQEGLILGLKHLSQFVP